MGENTFTHHFVEISLCFILIYVDIYFKYAHTSNEWIIPQNKLLIFFYLILTVQPFNASKPHPLLCAIELNKENNHDFYYSLLQL